MLEKLCGNKELTKSLLAAISGGRLSHSVLICGEAGAGVNFAARCLAADYLYPEGGDAASAVIRGEGAECITISGEGASGDIKIDSIREARREVYNTSISAAGRCVLIRNAQRLNAPSANAILKVLEEPPNNVLFILTSSSEAAVLPTIRSRCSIYNVCPPSTDECSEYLIAQGADENKARQLADIFGGLIGLAKKIHENDAEAAIFDKAEALYKAFEAKDEYTTATILASFEKDKPSAQKLFAYSRILIARALSDKNLTHRASIALCEIYEASRRLSRNAGAKLVFTVLAARLCE